MRYHTDNFFLSVRLVDVIELFSSSYSLVISISVFLNFPSQNSCLKCQLKFYFITWAQTQATFKLNSRGIILLRCTSRDLILFQVGSRCYYLAMHAVKYRRGALSIPKFHLSLSWTSVVRKSREKVSTSDTSSLVRYVSQPNLSGRRSIWPQNESFSKNTPRFWPEWKHFISRTHLRFIPSSILKEIRVSFRITHFE